MSADDQREIKRPRLARRKQETRTRLLKAAYALMSQKGKDGVSIQEITMAADVGFGTFYNYFASKSAVYDALVEELIEAFAHVVDQAVNHLQDPAERLSVGVQYTLFQARSDPAWGSFLANSLMDYEVMDKGLGRFLLRDVQEGVNLKRFTADDLFMMLVAIGATVHAVLNVERHSAGAAMDGMKSRKPPVGTKAKIPERTAAQVLRMLGLPHDEAIAIARKPLPALKSFADAFQ